ncbi:hypothetical protein M422DRAFT_45099 [Sphaerobolus stellatus SS14]|nr:hypothetical protein M422DRAFT_45099 [Sphaerobolus stellatus SS14]
MSKDRQERYDEPLPPIRSIFGDVLSEPRPRTSLGHRPPSHIRPSSPAMYSGYTGSAHYHSSFVSSGPHQSDRRLPSSSSQTPRVPSQSFTYDPALKLPPLRLPSDTLPSRRPVSRVSSPALPPPLPPAPAQQVRKEVVEKPRVPTLALSPPGYERQPLTKPYAPMSPTHPSGRSKSPKPSVMVHYRLNPPVPEGAPDIYTYATPTGTAQPSTGPANYSFTVMREQQGDLVDVRTPSARAQGILRPTAILEDEDQSHKRYRCEHPGCDKKYDRPSSLEVHRHTHSGNLRESHDFKFKSYITKKADTQSSTEAFTCEFPGCNRKFGVKSNMLRHHRTNHGKKEANQSTERITITPYGDKGRPQEEDTRFFHNIARDPVRIASPQPEASSSHKKP